MKRPSRACAVLVTATLLLLLPGSALAHQHRPVAGFETTVGWLDEPAYAGFKNAVQIRIEKPAESHDDHAHEGEDSHAAGDPVENAKLQVEVIFGDETGSEKIGPMDLTPAFGAPGEYRAALIPTQPGTYTFHIFGTIGKVEFDEMYTSGEAGAREDSEGTYNDIREPRDIQFPAKHASAVDLESKVDAETQKLAAATSEADGSASTATVLAIVALVVAVLGSAAAMLRKPKAS